jgi:homoserine dehydrogenase
VSVVADVLDVAHAKINGAAGLMTKGIQLSHRAVAPLGEIETAYYLRFEVFDRPGVLARITGALGEARISIQEMVQQGGGDASGAPVQVVMMTHIAKEHALRAALAQIAGADFIARAPHVIRVVA